MESMYDHDSIIAEVLEMIRNNEYSHVEYTAYDADDNSGFLIVQNKETEPFTRYEIDGEGYVKSHKSGNLLDLKS